MLQVTKILHQGHGLAKALLKRAATVELEWELRRQAHFECTDSQGRQLAVFLPPGSVVRGGDVLVAEDGSMVRVAAKPQPLMQVRPGDRGSATDLLRAAYHLGNRHVAIEPHVDHLKIEPDPALAEMLRALHLAVTDTFGSFEPEGAFEGHGDHLHDEHHTAHRHTGTPEDHEHEHDTQVHDHEHDSHRHGEHGQSRG
ncbi:MAG TPA: urease accessory protein UreE [Ramlibacter sp.]|uniref:urease accessory protein UreE n=1 Tax=Ramlibacter sp. TaxID=1917967 RepID=UPI002D80A04A|nr:urease accessory protein UreE [Ramlibacter sp.]HET8745113.1 urease accessory protein UreE [Ramlibacter sp.]